MSESPGPGVSEHGIRAPLENAAACEVARSKMLAEIGVVGGAPEAVFDAIASLATRLTGLPSAALSFLTTDGFWVKAGIGHPTGHLPREQSGLCDEVVAQRQVVLVPDATLAPGHASHPLVAAGKIGCYVGAPLCQADGTVLGAISASGPRARRLSLELAASLNELALIAMREIEARFAALRMRQAELELAASERRFRALVRNSSDIFTVVDENLQLTFESEAASRILGRPSEAVVGSPIFSQMHPDDAAASWAHIAYLRAHPGETTVGRFRLFHPAANRWRVFEVHAQNRLDDPDVRGFVSNLTDITTRVEAEEALRASERRFRSLVQNSSDIVTLVNPDGVVLHESDSVRPILGSDPERRIGRDAWEFVHPADQPAVKRWLQQFVGGENRGEPEAYRVLAGDGTYRWLETRGTNLLDDPAIGGIVLNSRDVTSRRVAEEGVALRDHYLAGTVAMQQELLRPGRLEDRVDGALAALGRASQTCRILFFEFERDGTGELVAALLRAEWCSPGTASVQRESGLRVRTSRFSDSMRETLAGGGISAALTRELTKRERVAFERVGVRASLHAPVLVRGQPHGLLGFHATEERRWSQAEQDHLLGAASSLSLAIENERTSAALQQETERLRVTLGAIADAVIATDARGLITLANPVAERLLGWRSAELQGRLLTELFEVRKPQPGDPSPPHPRGSASDAVAHVLRTGETLLSHRHVWALTHNGTRIHAANSTAPIRDAAGRIIGVVRVFRDLTAEDRLQAEMVKAEKLEGLSVIAAGIAHDFNNILTAVLGNVSVARAMLGTGHDELGARLREAEAAGVRARELTAQMLTFTKGGAPIKQLARLDEIVRESVSFALHGSRTRADILVPDDLPPVEADSGQISQVMQNLALNAAQSMPDGGTLSVRGCTRAVNGSESLPVPVGEYVEISFRDEGEGIPPAIRGKIFDPFFTTKSGGTGLGLATAYGIIRAHGGCIDVESAAGKGSTFRVLLPASADRAPERKVTVRIPHFDSRQRRGVRVLLMDDDEHVRPIAGRMIAGLGYEVELSVDEAAALACFRAAREAGRPFRIAVLDLTIPGGPGGLSAVRRLREEDPELLTIACSGYISDEVRADCQRLGFTSILAKPYRVHEMAAALDQVLAGEHRQ